MTEDGVEPDHTRGEDAHRQSVVDRCRASVESLSLAIQIGREEISKTALHVKGGGGTSRGGGTATTPGCMLAEVIPVSLAAPHLDETLLFI